MPDQPEIHVITGLPRAGSTLLQDLLNQNPAFHASSTSPVADTVRGVADFWSGSAEVRSEIHAGNQDRMVTSLEGLIRGWYAEHDQKEIIFDKGRPWIAMVDRFRQLHPQGLVFCCVRDPRNIFASILKVHARFPLLDEMPGATVFARADRMFAPDGLIGGPLTHIEDQIRLKSKVVVPIVFERMVEEPERVMRLIYAELKRDYFDRHNFDEVESTSTDLDVQYTGGKYPHRYGTRPVHPPETDWKDHIPAIVAKLIIERYPIYCSLFSYT